MVPLKFSNSGDSFLTIGKRAHLRRLTFVTTTLNVMGKLACSCTLRFQPKGKGHFIFVDLAYFPIGVPCMEQGVNPAWLPGCETSLEQGDSCYLLPFPAGLCSYLLDPFPCAALTFSGTWMWVQVQLWDTFHEQP